MSGNQGAAVRVGASLPRLEPSTGEYSTPPPPPTPYNHTLHLTQQPPTLLIKAFHGLFTSGKCRSWTERVESLFYGNKRARCVHNLSLRGHSKGGAVVPGFLARQKNATLVIYKAVRFCFPESPCRCVFATQCGASSSRQRTPINTSDRLITFSSL